jgi:signal transduction histidine kinase
LAVTSLLLAGCVALYLTIAIAIFKSDKQQMVFDLNRGMVSNISSELETQFASLSDKIELYALSSYQKELKREFLENLLQHSKDLVYLAIWKQDGGTRHFEQEFLRAEYAKTYGLQKSFFTEREFQNKNLNLQKISQQGELIWNATLSGGPPLVGYARSVAVEDALGRPVDRVAVIAFVDAANFLKTISEIQSTDVFVATDTGEVLVHKDPKKMLQNYSIKDSAVFATASASPVKKEVVQTRAGGEEILGAFAKIFNGHLYVIAETNGRKAFSVVDDLIRRSLIFSLIVFTGAFMAAVIFSTSLTRPLESLTEAMNQVSEGDLDIQIHLHTRDEIEYLAKSFNQMIGDLRKSRLELEEINRDLEDKVKERTLQLERQNQAVKEAQEALLTTTRLASVGEIAGRAAHEVLNPLTSMMTRLENVQRRLDSQEKMHVKVLDDIRAAWNQDYKEGGFTRLVENWKKASSIHAGANLWQEDIGNIESVVAGWKGEIQDLLKDARFLLQEGDRINKIVGQMRSLSVIKSSRQVGPLAALMVKCRDIMADLMEKHAIQFNVEPFDPAVQISIDPDEFVQSMTNLLRNSQQAVAAAASSRPGHQGFVVMHAVTRGQDICLFVEDNGVGIDQEHQAKLFETQFSTKPKEEGTGLGLNISRRFLRAAGGEIEFVESLPFKRTVFKITLPVHSLKQEAAA